MVKIYHIMKSYKTEFFVDFVLSKAELASV